jgi:hypothetical protein
VFLTLYVSSRWGMPVRRRLTRVSISEAVLSFVGLFVFVFQVYRAGLHASLASKAEKISRDRYLGTMEQDPLYTWRPDGDITRTEVFSPKNYSKWVRSGVSRITVKVVYRTGGDASSLLRQAQQVSTDAGYVDGRRVSPSGLGIQSRMRITRAGHGIVIVLSAPA